MNVLLNAIDEKGITFRISIDPTFYELEEDETDGIVLMINKFNKNVAYRIVGCDYMTLHHLTNGYNINANN